MSLAIFDLDNTLLGGDSDYLWGEFLIEKGLVDAKYYHSKNESFYEDYKSGQLDILEFLQFSLKPLTQHEPDILNKLHSSFMAEKIAPIMLPKAIRLLDQHRKQGDYLLIITATNRFVTEPIAQQLGVDELIATEAEKIDQRYTGKVKGTPCFQEGKVIRLKEWLEHSRHTLEDSWFYSDSHNDIPLLEKVSHPVAVDADDTLQKYADKNGWKSMSLRE